MAIVVFTSHLNGVAPKEPATYAGDTVGDVLAQVFAEHAGLRHYVLDDQGRLRRHVVLFLDDQRLDHGIALGCPVGEMSEIYVLQALSGG